MICKINVTAAGINGQQELKKNHLAVQNVKDMIGILGKREKLMPKGIFKRMKKRLDKLTAYAKLSHKPKVSGPVSLMPHRTDTGPEDRK